MLHDKTRWRLVAGAEAEALRANGKYRPGVKPHWVDQAGQLFVLVNETWRQWHACFQSQRLAVKEDK